MSRHEKLSPIDLPRFSHHPSEEEFTLDVTLRLRLDELLLRPAPASEAPPSKPSQAQLCKLAGAIYDARRKRDKMLKLALFGEPVWDMLLALYCLPSRGERLRVTALSYAANVPPSTGHRAQAALTKHGLIERISDAADARMQIVQLTDRGRSLMDNYLESLFNCENGLRQSLAIDPTLACSSRKGIAEFD